MSRSEYPARMQTLGHEYLNELYQVKSLTVPLGTTHVVLNPQGQGISFTSDGTTPTASVGIQLQAGERYGFRGDYSAFQFIELTPSAVLVVEYYGFPGKAQPAVATEPDFFTPLKTSIVVALGGNTPTFTRASTAMVRDWENLYRNALSGEARFQGARRVENQVVSDSSTLAVSAANTMTLTAGTYLFSMGAGTGTVTFSGTGGATGTLAANATKRTVISKTVTAGTFIVTASVATLIDLQTEDTTGRTDVTNPSEYVSVGVLSAPYHGANVDGVKYFATTNGNSVASNVVTAGNGLPLDPSYVIDGVFVYAVTAERVDSTAYNVGDRMIPPNAGGPAGGDGFWYECTVAGTSAASLPTLDTTIGNTTTDGGVTWTNRGYYRLAGYLSEEGRTNVSNESRDFSAWTTVTSAAATSGTGIDGTSQTITLTDTDAGVAEYRQGNINSILSNSLQYATSVYVPYEAAPTFYPAISVTYAAGTTSLTGWVILNTQTGVLTDVVTDYDSATATREGDWWKVEIVMTNNATGNTTLARKAYPAYSSDGTNGDIAAQGSTIFDNYQFELGPSASSPIPTSGAAVTRSADSLSYAIAATDYDTQGTILADVANIPGGATNPGIVVMGNSQGLRANTSLVVSPYDGTTFASGGLPALTTRQTRIGMHWGGSVMQDSQNGTNGNSITFDGDMNPASSALILGENDSWLISNVRIYANDVGTVRLAELTGAN